MSIEKEVKISREFSFLPDPDHEGRTKEIRHYKNEKLVARYGSVYDENGNVIGVRQLRVEDVAPLSLLEKVKKSLFKAPEKLDYLNWIGVINLIGTINKVNKVGTIEVIEVIKLLKEITSIKNIETIGKDNISSPRAEKALEAEASSEAYDTEQTGSGKLIYAIFSTITVGGRDNLRPRIEIDGVQKLVHDQTFANWHFYVNDANEGIAIGVYDTTNNFYTLIVTLNLRFHSSLKVGFFNEDEANAQAGTVGYIYEKIT